MDALMEYYWRTKYSTNLDIYQHKFAPNGEDIVAENTIYVLFSKMCCDGYFQILEK